MTFRSLRPLAAAVAVLTLVVGRGTSGDSAAPSGKLAVVAAEDFWGSLARQLGGDHVRVESLIVPPSFGILATATAAYLATFLVSRPTSMSR